MMATTSPTARHMGPAAIAFGDPLDLVRLGSHSPRSVCETCKTINLGSRRFCKGCTGKLPAYFATRDGLATEAPLAQGLLLVQARRVPLASACVGALLLTLAVAAGLPEKALSSDDPASEPPVRQAALVPLGAVALPAQAAAPVTVEREPTLATSAYLPESRMLDPDQNEDEAIVESAAVERPVRKAAAVRRAVPATSRVPGVQSASVQLAKCDEMNFFARAMCVNRTCAEPSAARASSCAQPIRQRRLDEARRNPTLVG